MKVNLNIEEDDMFRQHVKRLIEGQVRHVLREQLSGIRVIRAFARESVERDRFRVANTELADTALAAGRWQVAGTAPRCPPLSVTRVRLLPPGRVPTVRRPRRVAVEG